MKTEKHLKRWQNSIYSIKIQFSDGRASILLLRLQVHVGT